MCSKCRRAYARLADAIEQADAFLLDRDRAEAAERKRLTPRARPKSKGSAA